MLRVGLRHDPARRSGHFAEHQRLLRVTDEVFTRADDARLTDGHQVVLVALQNGDDEIVRGGGHGGYVRHAVEAVPDVRNCQRGWLRVGESDTELFIRLEFRLQIKSALVLCLDVKACRAASLRALLEAATADDAFRVINRSGRHRNRKREPGGGENRRAGENPRHAHDARHARRDCDGDKVLPSRKVEDVRLLVRLRGFLLHNIEREGVEIRRDAPKVVILIEQHSSDDVSLVCTVRLRLDKAHEHRLGRVGDCRRHCDGGDRHSAGEGGGRRAERAGVARGFILFRRQRPVRYGCSVRSGGLEDVREGKHAVRVALFDRHARR
mmetsp:Transcript_516/g.1809  ORF Transcript_516/g.1809 Transcript_516/m.1809 type:complete len:325 (-) Transcript_516:17823-18797(-)